MIPLICFSVLFFTRCWNMICLSRHLKEEQLSYLNYQRRSMYAQCLNTNAVFLENLKLMCFQHLWKQGHAWRCLVYFLNYNFCSSLISVCVCRSGHYTTDFESSLLFGYQFLAQMLCSKFLLLNYIDTVIL